MNFAEPIYCAHANHTIVGRDRFGDEVHNCADCDLNFTVVQVKAIGAKAETGR